MYCGKCGKEQPEGVNFCPFCGNKHKTSGMLPDLGDVLVKGNELAKHIVPKKLSAMFPAVMPVGFVGIYAVLAVVIIVIISNVSGGHDLSGAYYTSEFFPVNSIVFDNNGKVTAYSYLGYSDTYYGKYQKRGNKYYVTFSDGDSSSGNPILQLDASSIGSQMGLIVEKADNGGLWIQIDAKISYWAWNGEEAYFSRY